MKKTFNNVSLVCKMQKEIEPSKNHALTGAISRNGNKFIFEEEATASKPHTRNPKIYDGNYVSLVRKKDNTLQFAFKKMDVDFDHDKFALDVYIEVSNALTQSK